MKIKIDCTGMVEHANNAMKNATKALNECTAKMKVKKVKKYLKTADKLMDEMDNMEED